MGLPDPLPSQYERKTPVWLLLSWFLLVLTIVACPIYLASALPDAWAAVLVAFAVFYGAGILWVPIRLLIGGRVALVFDGEGLEDRTGWRVHRVSWSNVKSVRLVKAAYAVRISVWLHEDPDWTRSSKRGAVSRNDWSAEDFSINQLWTLLNPDEARSLFEHYGGVRVTH